MTVVTGVECGGRRWGKVICRRCDRRTTGSPSTVRGSSTVMETDFTRNLEGSCRENRGSQESRL